MKLVERISQKEGTTPQQQQRSMIGGQSAKRERNAMAAGFQQLKLAVHNRLFETLDVSRLESLEANMAATKVTQAITEILDEEGRLLTDTDRARLVEEIKNELLGLGPLEPLLWDEDVNDILVNGPNQVYVERQGKLYLTDVRFNDDQHLMLIIDRIVSQVGRRVDESSPMVDARLPDGSRVNAIIPPLALDGPALSIRRFGTGPLVANQLGELKRISAEMMELLAAAVRARISILISGGTGAGKTTLLNILSRYIPKHERIVTIEDAAERQLAQENIVRLETRPPNVEGLGAIRQRQLLINSLRMRPDRIIIGEVRGEEAFDMLQAMNTGHEGSMATIHATTTRDALSRLESMVAMTNLNLPETTVRQQMASAIAIVVQVSRLSDGTRKVVNISEITGMEENIISMHEIFSFNKRGIGPDGKVVGAFQPTQIRPKFLERLRVSGIFLPPAMFEQVLEVN